MSKQSEAKNEQGYLAKSNTCSNCGHFQSDVILPAWCVETNKIHEARGAKPHYVLGETHGGVERNMRCSVGGFAVKKSATCNIHVLVLRK